MPDKPRTGQSVITPLVMMLIAAAAVLALWAALRKDNEYRVADIVEAVSYAARSEIARQLIIQFRAIERARDFWSEYALVPVEQWQADAMVEIDHFAGLEVIAWTERDGPRFFSSGPSVALNHEATDEEWVMIQDALDEAYGADRDTVAGPTFDNSGHAVLRLYLPVRTDTREAVMIAIIDVTDQITALLEDESPGYDILVTCCDGMELFRSGDFDAAIPESWMHGGLIEPLDDVFWRVDHQPSPGLASDFRPFALNTVLIVGLALALAIGAIAYHSRRAEERAHAARAAERQVRALNEELEDHIKQRTRDLNDTLTDLNTISLSVGHDVRSPLNAASLTTESLLKIHSGDDDTTIRLERIRSGIERTNLILDRLTTLSRVFSFATERRELDIEALARQVGDEVVTDGEAQLTVGTMPPAYADPTMTHILLTNLIANAVRHGGGDLPPRIEVGSRLEHGETTYFVRDHGQGIDAAARASLFAPAPIEPGRKRDSEGLGLGLAIAARVVARHGGTIWAEDTEGGGATFCFRLPRHRAGFTNPQVNSAVDSRN